MLNLILLTALMGQCPAGQCDVATFAAGISVATETPAPVRFVVARKPLRTRVARLRENKPVRRGLARLARRLRR